MQDGEVARRHDIHVGDSLETAIVQNTRGQPAQNLVLRMGSAARINYTEVRRMKRLSDLDVGLHECSQALALDSLHGLSGVGRHGGLRCHERERGGAPQLPGSAQGPWTRVPWDRCPASDLLRQANQGGWTFAVGPGPYRAARAGPLGERRYDPPRAVEVERDGRWWPVLQSAWRLLDDGRGWMAEVNYVVEYEWGREKHLGAVPADRVRLPDQRNP